MLVVARTQQETLPAATRRARRVHHHRTRAGRWPLRTRRPRLFCSSNSESGERTIIAFVSVFSACTAATRCCSNASGERWVFLCRRLVLDLVAGPARTTPLRLAAVHPIGPRIADRGQASDEPCPFDRVIAVDELDAQSLGLGIDHQRIARGEAVECCPARLLVQMRAGDVDHRACAHQRFTQ